MHGFTHCSVCVDQCFSEVVLHPKTAQQQNSLILDLILDLILSDPSH